MRTSPLAHRPPRVRPQLGVLAAVLLLLLVPPAVLASPERALDGALVPALPDGQIPLTVSTSSGDALAARVTELGGRVQYVFEAIDAMAITLPPEAVDEFLADPRVDSAQRQRRVRLATRPPEFPNPSRTPPHSRETSGDIVPLPGGASVTAHPLPLSELSETARGSAPSSFLGYDLITGAAESWEIADYGEGTIVAVIDTGIFPGHPMIEGNVIGGFNLVPADEEHAIDADGDGAADGRDFDWDAIENNGHGTFVSGMIAGHADVTMPADSPLAASVAFHSPETVTVDGDMATLRLAGAAPGASLYGVKVFPYDGGSAPDARVAEAIDRLVAKKRHGTLDVDVINMSLSGPVLFDGWNPLDLVVNAATFHGITVVSAAGNEGPALTSLGSPASALTGLAVGGAIDPMHTRIAFEVFFGAEPGVGNVVFPNDDLQIVDFSARGLTADRRAKPDLIATAFLLFSSTLVDLDGNGLNETPSFGFSSGTSFSSPTVAGCAALVTAFAENHGRFGRAPFVANALRRSAFPIGELPEVSPREQGRGFVDVASAIELVGHGNVWNPGHADKRHTRQKHFAFGHSVSGQAHGIGPGESFQFLIDVPERVSRIHFEFPVVELDATQNPFFGDAAAVTIHSAKRGGAGDYVFGTGGIEPGGSFDYEWPEPGTMRVTVVGSPTNYGNVGLRFDADAEYADLPVDEHFSGRLRRDELTQHEVEVPAGLAALAVRLSWRHDWTRWPTYDLDMFVQGPDGIVPVASLDSPELAWIENPTPGTWTFWIQDLGTVIRREPYDLDLAFVSTRFRPEVGLDDAPAERVRVTGAQPNPTKAATELSFALPIDVEDVDLAVFDVTGRRVRQLARGPLAAGNHEILWDGRSESGERVAAGIYFAKLHTPQGSSSRKVLLLK